MSETRHCFHIRLLLYYLQAEPRKRTVTDAAHFLGKSKVAVSRALSELEKQGFVERAASRKTVLSAYGGKVAEEYRRKLGIAQTYLQSLDLPPLQAKEDAMAAITAGFSEEYFKRMEERQQHMQIKENFAGRQSFSGSELCEQLDDGSYTLPFVIYREHIQHGNMISMGNRGFEHPCELIVKNHVGMLYLTIATVRAPFCTERRDSGRESSGVAVPDGGLLLSGRAGGKICVFSRIRAPFCLDGQGQGANSAWERLHENALQCRHAAYAGKYGGFYSDDLLMKRQFHFLLQIRNNRKPLHFQETGAFPTIKVGNLLHA